MAPPLWSLLRPLLALRLQEVGRLPPAPCQGPSLYPASGQGRTWTGPLAPALPAVLTGVFSGPWRCGPGACEGCWGAAGCGLGLHCLQTLERGRCQSMVKANFRQPVSPHPRPRPLSLSKHAQYAPRAPGFSTDTRPPEKGVPVHCYVLCPSPRRDHQPPGRDVALPSRWALNTRCDPGTGLPLRPQLAPRRTWPFLTPAGPTPGPCGPGGAGFSWARAGPRVS